MRQLLRRRNVVLSKLSKMDRSQFRRFHPIYSKSGGGIYRRCIRITDDRTSGAIKTPSSIRKVAAKSLPCRHSQPALDKTPRRHLRRVVGIPAEDKRRGLFKSARAKNKGWFTAIFCARHGDREREREIGFLLSSPRNFNSWTRVQSFPPPLFSVRIRSYRFHAFNIADSPRSCESIPLVFFRACICKGRYLSRFWLERSFLFVLETNVLWNFFRTEKRERAKFNLILSICLLRVKIWNRKIRRIM